VEGLSRPITRQLGNTDRVADLTRGLTLTRSRYRHGLIGALAVKQAQTILDQTAAQKQALEIQRAQPEHAIAALLGRTIEGSSHEHFVTAVYLYLDAVNLVGPYSAAGPISC
jgi:outer membrane protein TolC